MLRIHKLSKYYFSHDLTKKCAETGEMGHYVRGIVKEEFLVVIMG